MGRTTRLKYRCEDIERVCDFLGFVPDELDSKLGGELWVCVGVVRDQFHVKRFDQPEKLGPDIANPDRSERAPNEARAHVVAPPGKTGRGFARQLVLDHELATES